MLATSAAQPGVPPSGDEWVHEVKWDGIRLMAEIVDGVPRLLNRSGGDVSVAYPELLAGMAGLPEDVLLDGEVIALNPAGVPTLQAIASRIHVRQKGRAERLARAHPVMFMAFDVMRLYGVHMLTTPLDERRGVLERLELETRTSAAAPEWVRDGRSPWQTPPRYDDGALLAQATAAQGLEGVVSKRRTSPYRPGIRSADWVKVPHRTELVGVIGGWVPETDTADRLGAVWIGHPADDATFTRTGLMYPIARVGSGLPHSQRRDLLTVLKQITRDTCPFDPPPVGPEVRRTTWVEPAISVQVRYLGTTEAGVLRQPVMRCLRPEVTPLEAPYAELKDVPG